MLRTLLVLLVGYLPFLAYAQTCASEGIIFSTQEEIDDFSINYPGCTEILGTVQVTDGITSLEGLNSITSIGGSFYIRENDSLIDLEGLENLSYVGGDFYIMLNDRLKNLDGLNNLSATGGNLYISYNDSLTNLLALNNLVSIGGSLNIGEDSLLVNLDGLSSLSSIGDDLFIFDNFSLSNIDSLHNVTVIGRDAIIENSPLLVNLNGLSNLSSVGGLFSLSNNDLLTNLDGLSNLVSVANNFGIIDNDLLTSLSGVENLVSIGGNFYLISNSSLTDLSGMSNLATINEDFFITWNDALTSLDGLNNLSIGKGLKIESNNSLTNLDGLIGLTTMSETLLIKSNALLENIDGLSSVSSNIDWLTITDNPLLVDIDGLSNILSVERWIKIRDNDLLTSLDGIADVDFTGNTLAITGNSQLSNCAVQAICEYLETAATSDVEIAGNLGGCNSIDEVLGDCSGLAFTGYIYYDFNQNQQKDTFEAGIPMQQLEVNQQDDILFSNRNGHYFKICEEGQPYTFTLVDDADWTLTTDSISYSVVFEANNPSNRNNNFGLYPNFSSHDYSINMTAGQLRCDTDVNFQVEVCNRGTFLESGEGIVSINYPEHVGYVNAIPTPFAVDEVNRTISWAYDTLYPWQCLDYVVTLHLPGADFIGDPIELSTQAFRDSLGISLLAEQQAYEGIILCAYDPNDKQVYPGGEQDENFTDKEETLDYTVRFQNTGNIYAIDVTIQDTLDANLDWSTFRVVQASHDVQTIKTQDSIITFYFENINLPDSLSNPLGSQGFVRYTIDPMIGLPDYTAITNTAYIYFDANPPIVTNTTLNTLVDEIPVGVADLTDDGTISLYPNPTTGRVQILLHESLNVDGLRWQLSDATGRIVEKSYGIFIGNSITLDLENYQNGLYTILIQDFKTGKVMMGRRILLLK